MKNTVQKYCLFLIYANIFAKKCIKYDNIETQNDIKNILNSEKRTFWSKILQIRLREKMFKITRNRTNVVFCKSSPTRPRAIYKEERENKYLDRNFDRYPRGAPSKLRSHLRANNKLLTLKIKINFIFTLKILYIPNICSNFAA